ncbi:MAG TPA: hypothetical protein PK771_00470 [Spirochaetota bacterium]|nr:hypothetical protein [Spirochaetota bacterium]
MKKKTCITILILFLSFFLYSNDNTGDVTSDLIIRNISIKGIKYTLKRISKDLPIKSGDFWNKINKDKLSDFIKKMQDKKLLENTPPLIKEVVNENTVDIDITLSEQLSFFFFIFPFYSTTYLFKAKIKYWNFYIDGYEFPFEAELEFLQKDRFNFAVRSTDPITLNKFLSFNFDFTAYTTTINYLIPFENTRLNEAWKNGIESIYFKFNYKDPKNNISFTPSLGFGYANSLTADPTGDITKVDNEYHVLMIAPKFGFNIPLEKINSNFGGDVGFGFKNEYQVKEHRNKLFAKQEISISLVPHNLKDIPKDIKDPLGYPINLNYNYTFPKINIGLSAKTNFALRKFLQNDNNINYVDDILIQEFDKGVFEDTILNYQEIKNNKEKLEKLKSWYRYDDDNKKYILNNVSVEEKLSIWQILTDPKVGFIYSNGVLVNPSLTFTFPIKDSGFSLLPSLSFGYTNKWQDEKSNNNSISLSQELNFNYDIKVIDASLKGGVGFSYSLSYKSYTRDLYYDFYDIQNTFSLSKINLAFTKNIPLYESFLNVQKIPEYLRKKSGHKIKLNINFEDDPIITNGVFNPNNFRFIFETQYSLYLPTYKENRFKMRLSLFGAYNKNNERIGDENILGNWIRGKGYDFFGGFFGVITNFEYWIHLFNIKTPKFLGTKIDKEFIWQIFWIFYTDVALSFNDKIKDPFTIDFNNLHLLPAVTIGTSIKVLPKFMPLIINIDVNFNTYNLLRNKNLLGNLFFEFSIGRQVDGNWFSL